MSSRPTIFKQLHYFFQRSFRQVSQVIKIGHLAQVESLLTPQVLKVKDRFGRSLAHRAVLYERRHVLRHLIKVKPDLVLCVDQVIIYPNIRKKTRILPIKADFTY